MTRSQQQAFWRRPSTVVDGQSNGATKRGVTCGLPPMVERTMPTYEVGQVGDDDTARHCWSQGFVLQRRQHQRCAAPGHCPVLRGTSGLLALCVHNQHHRGHSCSILCATGCLFAVGGHFHSHCHCAFGRLHHAAYQDAFFGCHTLPMPRRVQPPHGDIACWPTPSLPKLQHAPPTPGNNAHQ